MIKSIDYDKLKSVAGGTPISRAALTMLTERTRARQETTVRRLKRELSARGVTAKTEQVQKFLSDLQSCGAGRVVFGKNKTARFVWDFDLKDVAAFALGKPLPKSKAKNAKPRDQVTVNVKAPPKQALPKLSPPLEIEGRAPVAPMTQAISDPVSKTMTIRRDGQEFIIPLDITADEAEAASRVIGQALARASAS